MASGVGAPVICPSIESMLWHPLPSTGSARSRSPASSVLWNAPTPARPSRRASFPSRYGTAPALGLRSSEPRVHGLRAWAVRSGARPDSMTRRRSGLPGSCGTPACTCPALRPRRARHARPSHDVSTRPSVFPNDVGARTVLSLEAPSRGLHTPLCTLRRADRSATTQHSVPAGGHPLPGGLENPLGSIRRFPRCFPLSVYISSSSSRLRLAH